MSWWVHLCGSDGEPLAVRSHVKGGTYCAGECDEADLNITYNYSKFYHEHLDKEEGLRWLNGKIASDCIERLEAAVKALGTERDGDYWKPTAGNAGHALNILLSWAKQNPSGIFGVN